MGEQDRSKIVLLLSADNLQERIKQLFFVNPKLSIVAVADAAEGINMARKLRPELICIGLNVCGMSMKECCCKIKMARELRDTPLVLITRDDKAEVPSCIRKGHYEIVALPTKRDELVNICRKYLGKNLLVARGATSLTIHFHDGDGCLLKPYALLYRDGGVFLQTETVLPVETTLTLSFYSMKKRENVEVDAQVAWVNLPENPLAPELPTGMGLCFPKLSSDDIWVVREFVQQTDISREHAEPLQPFRPAAYMLDALRRNGKRRADLHEDGSTQ